MATLVQLNKWHKHGQKLILTQYLKVPSKFVICMIWLCCFSFESTVLAGQLLWSYEVSNIPQSDDQGSAIAIDNQGRCYITGWIERGTATRPDIYVGCWNADGVYQWEDRHSNWTDKDHFGRDIVLKGSDSIYVVGERTYPDYPSNPSFYFMRYNSAGDLVDEQRLPSGGSPSTSVAVGMSHCYTSGIIVLGTWGGDWASHQLDYSLSPIGSFAIFKPSGNTSNVLKGDITHDGNCNVIECGRARRTSSGSYDIVVAKYNKDLGGLQYAFFPGSETYTATDNGSAIVTDSENNIYVTGYVRDANGQTQLVTFKMNSALQIQWSHLLSDIVGQHYSSEGINIAVDEEDNIYVCGSFSQTSTDADDIVTIKYSKNSSYQWHALWGGPALLTDEPVKIGTDQSGNVYVVGNTYDGDGSPANSYKDWLVLKYSSIGVLLDSVIWDGHLDTDEVMDAVVRNDGTVYVTGYTNTNDGSWENIVIARFGFPEVQHAPVAHIDAINPNPAIQGQAVTFVGHGTDQDDGDYITGYSWRSNIDGQLSTLASFNKSDLSVGSHTIYFKVQDNDLLWSPEVTAFLEVTLPNTPPTATIDNITPNPAIQGQSVTFTGHGTDPDAGDFIVAYSWRSDVDGQLSSQASFSTATLSVGTHTIYFKVQDNDGSWSIEHQMPLVINQYVNNPPIAIISDVAPNPAFLGQTVNLVGIGGDPDAGDYITGYSWRSNIDSQLSDQAFFSTNALSLGPHTIYFKVKDNHDVWSLEASLQLSIRQFSSFVHLTDPHVGLTTDANERFESLIAYINISLSPKPDFVVITGDLVDYGFLSPEWYNFVSLCSGFEMPCYAVVGNHDWWKFDFDLPDNLPYLAYFQDYSIQMEGLHLVSLNSGQNTDGPIEGFLWVGGLQVPIIDRLPEADGLSDATWAFLQNEMNAATNPNAVIAMHHPLLWDGLDGSFPDELETNGCITNHRSEFMNLCRTKGVSLVLSGHTHKDKQYTVTTDNHMNPLPDDPSGGFWNTNSMPALPVYVIGDACSENLAYRVIERDGNGFKVWKTQRINAKPMLNYTVYPYAATVPRKSGREFVGDSLSVALRMHAYDAQGHHVGVTSSGSIEYEIAGAYYATELATLDDPDSTLIVTRETISLLADQNERYTFRMEALAACSLSVYAKLIGVGEEGTTEIFYPSIAVDSGSIGVVYAAVDSVNYNLYVDDNGDGTTDHVVPPDSVVAPYVCGDDDGSGSVTISDAVYLINYIFAGGPAPNPPLSGDADCSGAVTISDAVYLINYIFSGGAAPCAACP